MGLPCQFGTDISGATISAGGFPMKTALAASLEALSVEELIAHIGAAQTILAAKQEKLREAFIEETRRKAEALGLSIEDLFSVATTKKPTGRDKGDKPSVRRPVAIKYRDPQNHESTWTGRGMKPRWLRDKIASGGKIEDFLLIA
jgi:DNA-binding protein H-NS